MFRSICVLLLLLTGCVEVPPVKETTSTRSFFGDLLKSCKAAGLVRDCDMWNGPNRHINISGTLARIGSNGDGSEIWLMHDPPLETGGNPFLLNRPNVSKSSNRAFEAVSHELEMHGVTVEKVEALKAFSDIIGYRLELNADGYRYLTKFTVRK